jgi:hypothetical protein
LYVRDSGIVHALLNIGSHEALLGHPVVGASREGCVVENLMAAAPPRTVPLFYRTATGNEIDLLLEMPGHGLWAIEIKHGLSARPEKGFFAASGDLKPARRFVVHSGTGHHSVSATLEAAGLRDLMTILAALKAR